MTKVHDNEIGMQNARIRVLMSKLNLFSSGGVVEIEYGTAFIQTQVMEDNVDVTLNLFWSGF